AQHRPSQRAAFKRLHLGIWQEQEASPWLDMGVYDEGAAPIDVAALAGQPCYIGVDLGFTEDLSAIVAAFPMADDSVALLPFLFAPDDTLLARQEQDGQPWIEWRDAGHL